MGGHFAQIFRKLDRVCAKFLHRGGGSDGSGGFDSGGGSNGGGGSDGGTEKGGLRKI